MLFLAPSAIAGRGVFTDADIAQGETFHRADLLMLDASAAEILRRHVFDVAGRPGMALSLAAMLNHQRQPNTTYRVDDMACALELTALRRVSAGEEVTIDYADYAAALGLA